MRRLVGRQQPRAVDAGIDLGRRQRGVAEQVLDGAQVAAAASRWVAKEWRSACGVAVSGSPSAPRIRSMASCTIRGDSGPPLAPTNSGPSAFERVGAEGEIVFDRLAHRRDDRRGAGLLALADDRHRIDRADRRVARA